MTKAEEEVLDDIPIDEMEADPFLSAKVAIDGITGHVHYIERDSVSKERLYLVRYHDGRYQHLTRSEVRVNLIEHNRAQLDELLEAAAAALRQRGMDDSCCYEAVAAALRQLGMDESCSHALVSRNRVS